MSTQSEITRITNDRDAMRTKLNLLGLTSGSPNLDDIKDAIVGLNGGASQGAFAPAAQIREGDTYTIVAGYYSGGTVTGIGGGGSYTLQAKGGASGITPTTALQTITADEGYYGLSSVTIGPIPSQYKDVTSVTATAADVLATKVIMTPSGSVAGTMANNGAIVRTLDTTTTSTTIPVGYHNGSGTVSISLESGSATPTTSSQTLTPTAGKVFSQFTVNAIPANFGDATGKTVAAADLLVGKTAIGVNGNGEAISITGTMPNNGAVSQTLLAGASYTVPSGYHNGSGSIYAASLASQTGVDTGKTAIVAATVLTGSQGWVNGAKITGSMENNGALNATLSGLGVVTGDMSFSIPAGYTTGGLVQISNAIETALAAI